MPAYHGPFALRNAFSVPDPEIQGLEALSRTFCSSVAVP